MKRTYRAVPLWVWSLVGLVFIAYGSILVLSRDADSAGRGVVVAVCTLVVVSLAVVARERVVIDDSHVRLIWMLRQDKIPVDDVSGFYLDPGAETVRMRTRDGGSLRTPLRIGLDVRRSPEGSRYDRLVSDLNSAREHWHRN